MSSIFFEYLPVDNMVLNKSNICEEKKIKSSIELLDTKASIQEITKVYWEINMLKHSVVKGFIGTSSDGIKSSSSICIAEGKVDLSIEYTLENISSQLNIISDYKYFSIYTMLPKNYNSDYNIVVNTNVDYISIHKLAPNKLSYLIHSLISFNVQ